MSVGVVLLFLTAATIGAWPLAHLVGLAVNGRSVDGPWWTMAGAFAVSFVSDFAGLLGYASAASQVYPLTQAALFCAVLIPRRAVEVLVAGLIMVATLSVLGRDANGLDLALHIAAWGSIAICGAFGLNRSLLRVTIVGGFAALSVAWIAFTLEPGWWSWGTMQLVRLATACAWCVAATRAVTGRTNAAT